MQIARKINSTNSLQYFAPIRSINKTSFKNALVWDTRYGKNAPGNLTRHLVS